MSLHRVPPKKSLGQHFLEDPRILDRIARAAQPSALSGLVEIGPGTGNLTAHLLALLAANGQPQHLCAIERDPRMRAVLAERFGSAVELFEGDAAQLDWAELLARPQLGQAPVIVGNLPYYAALPILFSLLDAPLRPARIVIMVQKEVADRLAAQPSTPAYGQVTVKVQMLADVRCLFRVGPGAFRPPPKVDSTVLELRPLPGPRFEVPDAERFRTLVTAGFGQRRKTLANALLAGADVAPAETRAALHGLGLDERTRGEALSVGQWAALATALSGA